MLQQRRFRDALELKLRRAKGDLLQQFLAELMSLVHGSNFVPASAAYSQGDLKCDGLLQDPLTIFACYGPVNGGSDLKAAAMKNAVAKVAEDCNGAVVHWPKLKQWFFVTNFVEGTPPQITQALLELQAVHSQIDIAHFGKAQFSDHIGNLPLEHIEELLGGAASDEDFEALHLAEVQSVVNDVMRSFIEEVRDDVPHTVPAGKLDFNKLPTIYRDRLMQGFRNADRVAIHLLNHPDPTLDGTIAAAFKGKYLDLKLQGLGPGEIMDHLYDFAMAGKKAQTPREVAVWSLLAHLFEQCTIFERDPAMVPS